MRRDLNSQGSVSPVAIGFPFRSCKGGTAGMGCKGLAERDVSRKAKGAAGERDAAKLQVCVFLVCQSSQLKFTFSFSYQCHYPDRLKTYSSACQRTNPWCTQAKRRDVPNAQLFMGKRALQQPQCAGAEIPGQLGSLLNPSFSP